MASLNRLRRITASCFEVRQKVPDRSRLRLQYRSIAQGPDFAQPQLSRRFVVNFRSRAEAPT